MRFIILSLVLFLGYSSVATAQLRYVVDAIYITVRSGVGDEYKVLRTIKSGTRMQVIQDGEGEDEGYMFVRLDDGVEGWVKKRYLVDQPIAADRIAGVERELKTVMADRDKARSSVSTMKARVKEMEKELKRLSSDRQKLQKKNEEISALAAKPMELKAENDKLTADNAEMRNELDTLRQKTAELESSGDLEWFISGALIIVAGVVIGLLLPNLRRRGNSWA
jgi:SH3 domain protein